MENVEALGIFFFLSTALLFFFRNAFALQYLYLIIFGFFALLQLAWHTAILIKIKQMRVKGKNYRNVVLVGVNKNMDAMIKKIESNKILAGNAGVFMIFGCLLEE